MGNDTPNNNDLTEEFLQQLNQHEESLRSYILAQMLNWSDADDIAQECRMRLWRQFNEYDRSKDFGAWARTIAHYLILAHRKSVQRKRQFSEQFLAVMGREFELVESESGERREALNACLGKLTDMQRDLLANSYARGATIKDVALAMGRSVRGMQKTVARIRAILQRCVDGVLQRECEP